MHGINVLVYTWISQYKKINIHVTVNTQEN